MVSKESSGAVLMKLTAMYTRMAIEAATNMALGIAIAQYLPQQRRRVNAGATCDHDKRGPA